MISPPEALKLILDLAQPLNSAPIELGDAVGMRLSDDVCADRDIPPADRSAMDGLNGEGPVR